jgi:hypothetical protein
MYFDDEFYEKVNKLSVPKGTPLSAKQTVDIEKVKRLYAQHVFTEKSRMVEDFKQVYLGDFEKEYQLIDRLQRKPEVEKMIRLDKAILEDATMLNWQEAYIDDSPTPMEVYNPWEPAPSGQSSRFGYQLHRSGKYQYPAYVCEMSYWVAILVDGVLYVRQKTEREYLGHPACINFIRGEVATRPVNKVWLNLSIKWQSSR